MRMRHTRDSCIEVKLKTVLNPQPSQCLYSLYRGVPGVRYLRSFTKGCRPGSAYCKSHSAASRALPRRGAASAPQLGRRVVMGIRYVIHYVPRSLRSLGTPRALAVGDVENFPDGIFAVVAKKEGADAKLGVTMQSSEGQYGEATGAVVIALASDSPLRGSLRLGDVILSIDGCPALNATSASHMLMSAVGQLLLVVVRSHLTPVRHVCVPPLKGDEKFGVHMASPERSDQEATAAPVVTHLAASSTLAREGVRIGDRVLCVNGIPVLGATDGSQLLKEASGKVVVTVLGNGRSSGHGKSKKLMHHANLAAAKTKLEEYLQEKHPL